MLKPHLVADWCDSAMPQDCIVEFFVITCAYFMIDNWTYVICQALAPAS